MEPGGTVLTHCKARGQTGNLMVHPCAQNKRSSPRTRSRNPQNKNRPVPATFDGGMLSSNGGVLILREIEKRLGLATVLSRHIPDNRDGRRVRHSYSDMTRARMFAIASGHEACDDLDVLRSDPALKMACGRLPVSGTDLMSQPTLSRLENAPCWRQTCAHGA